ncbi:glycosyltransferase [Salmonella enterica subsp. enterica serovar Typhimurium]|nr:glycosyltransferase [Salmonella enterica subsp. enterica serovar Typhimurium]
MKISLVVPVFNEEDTIPIFYKTVREFNELKEYEIEIVFINDGSKDATESIINKIAASDPLVIPLSFTRNFGKEPRQPGGCKLKTAPVRPVVAARPAEYVCSEDLFY